MHGWRRSRRVRRGHAALGLLLLLLGPGAVLLGLRSAAPPPVTTAAPPLVLRGGVVPVAGTLRGQVTLAGTISPSLPGMNMLTLRLTLPGGRRARGGHVGLVLTMPGMDMLPVRATLSADGALYRGSARLPMFGRYRAAVEARTASGRYSGTVTVVLPLTVE